MNSTPKRFVYYVPNNLFSQQLKLFSPTTPHIASV